MPTKISSREVLAYLNELGYNNISAQQLKEFMQDLKKLIKYEERKRYKESVEDTTTSSVHNQDSPPDIFAVLHSQRTISSQAKVIPKKESVIAVQIKRSKPQTCCSHNKENVLLETDSRVNNENKIENLENLQVLKEQQTDNLIDGSDNKGPTASKTKILRPTTSFIRPTIRTNHKSDPVALYHQYQAEWKRRKIPGEDNRTDLRWAIREKMLSGPKVI